MRPCPLPTHGSKVVTGGREVRYVVCWYSLRSGKKSFLIKRVALFVGLLKCVRPFPVLEHIGSVLYFLRRQVSVFFHVYLFEGKFARHFFFYQSTGLGTSVKDF